MTPHSPARRMALLCAAAFSVGYVFDWIAAVLRFWLLQLGGAVCPDTAVSVCRQLASVPGILSLMALACILPLAVAAFFSSARWVMRPIGELVPVIASLGPQNLGARIGARRGQDEMARLAHGIDEMMDRIATGYEAQRRFAADASHELRTPLAVQRTLIEVGMAKPLTPDQLQLLTAQLLETNERNERLIEGLLVLSESDRGLMSRAPLRLDLITGSVLADHAERTASAGVTVTSRLLPRVVVGEQVLLERLVTNLVQNAIKYNRPGGTLDVEVGDEPALRIVNTGDDVPPEAVTGLFEPFRRLAGTRIDHSGGAGLGLSIARSITQAHDGTISARSTGRDGLRVEVRFPTSPS